MIKAQSVYKTEFAFNNEYERYFLIEDKIYFLSDTAKMDINEAFKLEDNCNGILFKKTEKSSFVNVPFERFILLSDDLIIVEKDRSTTEDLIDDDLTMEEFKKEEMERWAIFFEELNLNKLEITLKEVKDVVDNSLETTEDFQDFVAFTLENSGNTLLNKGKEYTNTNWLDNFEEACKYKGLEINSTNLIKILDGYRLKQQVSIIKLHNDIANGKFISVDLINEKYGDLMNYNLLEQAIILKYNHINKISF
jgi:hypothetical protein